jgi:hypothetical protein
MATNIERTLTYNVLNAPLRPFPYPHIYVPEVFPPDFYAELQRRLPHPDAMIPIEQARPVKGYKERFVMDIGGPMETLTEEQRAFWSGLAGWLLSGRFRQVMLSRFKPYVEQRFQGAQGLEFREESLLIEDITNYALGPHTDAPSKVISVLFYLPKDDSQSHMGTSIYMPKNVGRGCPGGPHYGYEGFDRVATMPFRPNSMFAFVKSDWSFHGVEPVTDPDVRRWLLLYDIKVRQTQPAAPAPGASAGAAVR